MRPGDTAVRVARPARWPAVVTGVAAGLVALLAFRYQLYLSSQGEWGDESETIVAAKMMAAGMALYADIFNHHGPLTFLIAYILEHFGSFGVRAHRMPIIALQWLAIASLYFSPLLAERTARNLYAAVAGAVMVVYLPEMYGQTYQYQTIAGLLLVVVLAQYTLPAIACPERLHPRQVAGGNLLLACLPFFAVTYLPLAGLLFLASLRGPYVKRAVVFVAIGVAANVMFLAAAGSLRGYLAFHIYLNSSVLTLYNGGHGLPQLLGPAYAAVTQNLVGFLALLVVMCSAAALATRDSARVPWRSLLVATAMGTLLIRGGSQVHQLPFYYGCLALPLALLAQPARLSPQATAIALFLVLACAARLSLLAPIDRERMAARPIPLTTEFGQLARAVTAPHERIIAYTFQNYEYIAAGRLPASGHFFYLPWQEKYNENPRFGIRIDACAQIREARPKVITLDKGTVWGLYPWASYAQCVQSVVDEHYYQVPGKPFWLRNDLAPADVGVAAPGDAYGMAATLPLAAGAPTPLSMTEAHGAEGAALRGIAVLFGTHGRQNPGEARLELSTAEGTPVALPFGLAALEDNRYRYFELPPARYVRGQVVAVTGGGISAWQSRRGEAAPTTCIIYDYANGKRRFTPGCPLG